MIFKMNKLWKYYVSTNSMFWKNGLIFEGYKKVTKQLGGAEKQL